MLNKKRFLSIILTFILLLITTTSLAEVNLDDQLFIEGEFFQITASPWAESEIVDGERYGIYSKEIYENSLKELLTEDILNELLEGVENKLSQGNLEKNKDFIPLEINSWETRGGFLKEIYNRIAPYDKGESLSLDPILYLNEKGVLKGRGGEDFALDRKITIEEAIIFSKRGIGHIFNTNNIASKGLMWKVENKGNTVYLLGSIHYGNSSLYPFSNQVMEKYHKSDELYVEIDISNEEFIMEVTMELMEAMMEGILEKTMYKDGTTLEEVIGEELYSKVKTIMDNYEIGEESYKHSTVVNIINQLEDLKLMEDLNIDSLFPMGDLNIIDLDYGIDMYFLKKARADKKRIKELESIESQLEVLFKEFDFSMPYEDLSEEEQIKKLEATIESILNPSEEDLDDTSMDWGGLEMDLTQELEKQFQQIEDMIYAIRIGDEEKLVNIIKESGQLDIGETSLIGHRDVEMAKKIGKLLESSEEKTYFVVVGAAHFVLDNTILDNLQSMGYEIERINK